MVGCTPTFLESLFKVCFSSPICGLLVWLHCITLSANRTTGIKHTLKTSGGGVWETAKNNQKQHWTPTLRPGARPYEGTDFQFLICRPSEMQGPLRTPVIKQDATIVFRGAATRSNSM